MLSSRGSLTTASSKLLSRHVFRSSFGGVRQPDIVKPSHRSCFTLNSIVPSISTGCHRRMTTVSPINKTGDPFQLNNIYSNNTLPPMQFAPGVNKENYFVGLPKKLLIANRGEIAIRIIKSAKKLGISTVSIYTKPDEDSLHVSEATESVYLGPESGSYVDIDKLIAAAKSTGCDCVHPGYGFLSESPVFVERCSKEGIAFLGPNPSTMTQFGYKHESRIIAERAKMPTVPGSPLLKDLRDAREWSDILGYPVMLKATGGGGGIGMQLCQDNIELSAAYESVKKMATSHFKHDGVYLEKYIENSKHIEVQIFGDGHGNVVHLGERECFIQRRRQKVIEETPSPSLSPSQREAILDAAVRLGKIAKYRSAGTVEFVLDIKDNNFYFLEVNTRLQVEHGISELVNKVDLVEWMIRLGGANLGYTPTLDITKFKANSSGSAIQARLYAEDPMNNFRPSPGIISEASFPVQLPGCRVDTFVRNGTEISPNYDPMIAKIMAYGPTRPIAIQRLKHILDETRVLGTVSNIKFLASIIGSKKFGVGDTTTKFLADFNEFKPHRVDFLSSGLETTLQSYPGRTTNWRIGIPPSGPMDEYSCRLANALVGNDDEAAALEITLSGPSLKFSKATLFSICGASFDVTLSSDGHETLISNYIPTLAPANSILKIGNLTGTSGSRAYLAVQGGFDAPIYLGSSSTFPTGKFGGSQLRACKAGDALDICPLSATIDSDMDAATIEKSFSSFLAKVPSASTIKNTWEIECLLGPQTSPDFFTNDDMDMILKTEWKVHYNSNRLGIRLEGPRPTWARKNGGEGGSHPSNVHDHVYGIGAINFTGDMPVILTVDGPSLGGFVCPLTVTKSDFWKVGQVRAGDNITFKPVSLESALKKRFEMDTVISSVAAYARYTFNMTLNKKQNPYVYPKFVQKDQVFPKVNTKNPALLLHLPATDSRPSIQYRLGGDRYLYVEYGDMILDLNLRFRIHALEMWLKKEKLYGIIETTPGVRSLQIHYDLRRLPLSDLLSVLQSAESELPPIEELVIPSRILNLPMAFNCQWTREAIDRYMKSFRDDAPYLPSNIDFIAKNNGLKSEKDVEDIIFSASYMVLGLGDVYLGAPCAVPVDPRHRLFVPKYNPARVYTAEGTVGLGGAYMCIYPMNSPGGYQLVGRSLPIWNTFGNRGNRELFSPEKPWLLDMFDQVRFYRVSEEELLEKRREFELGKLNLNVKNEIFSIKDHNKFISEPLIANDVNRLRLKQGAAQDSQLFLEKQSLERIALKQKSSEGVDASVNIRKASMDTADHYELKDNELFVHSDLTAKVWETKVVEGSVVEVGDPLFILESMKMEYVIRATRKGKVRKIFAKKDQVVRQGDNMVVIEM